MGTQMTPVYSGGLVYEYSEEGSGYGLVTISGDSVSEGSSFTALQSEFGSNPAPSDDGGYKMTGTASECPSMSSTWEVKDFSGENLPAIPSGAADYMKNGAGKGPGLTGDGSQNAGGASSGTASAGSGQVTATATPSSGSSTSSSSSTASASGAANVLVRGEMSYAPFVCTAAVILSTLFGATLL